MKILIVEDDPEIAMAVREGLDDAGYTTQVVRDGERALRVAESGAFSLIVLDLMLPSMDGLEICRKLRRARQTVPILMVTARDTVPERVTGLEAGADDYLVKPFSFDELLARIRALLRRENTVKASLIEIADLIVDTQAKTAVRDGREIPLTGREYTLLEALAAHTGQILSRDAIQERVWSDDISVSNTVDVCVKNLRRKVDDPFEQKLIHTVYGLGYVLREEPPR
ncbi:MAG: response regulator transcription factor [Fimbriimonas sp.]|nr:response regulator transcription factor [Fimbriimonas sp.]